MHVSLLLKEVFVLPVMLDFKLLLILYHQVVIILVSELDFAISGLRESLMVLIDEAGYVVNAIG